MVSWHTKRSQTIRTQVNTDLSQLAQVLAWFNQIDHAAVPRFIWLQCELALAEGFTNAVRHAHYNLPVETPIEIELTLYDQAIELRIWDYGAGFDLEKSLQTLPWPNDQDIGGRGLKIIAQTADVFHYIPVERQRNCLLMIKTYGR